MDYPIDQIKKYQKYFGEEETVPAVQLPRKARRIDKSIGEDMFSSEKVCLEVYGVSPHIKVMEKIGEGGIGLVYHARDTEKEEDIALKLLNPSLFCGLDKDKKNHVIRKFRGEYEAGKSLERHLKNTDFTKRIIQFKDSYSKEDFHFFTMEYLNSGNLDNFIRSYWNQRKMNQNDYIKKGIEYAIKTLEGLDFLHSCDLVHRDIKPQNILLRKSNSQDDVLKITDFGLTQSSESLKKICFADIPGLECTLLHVSPEQVEATKDRKIRITKKSDIYSFGTSFYNYFTGIDRLGELQDTQSFTKFLRIMKEKYEMPHNMQEVPKELSPVLNWALASSPDQRGSALETKYAFVGAALKMGMPIDEIRSYALPFENDVTVPVFESLKYIGDEKVSDMVFEGLKAAGHRN